MVKDENKGVKLVIIIFILILTMVVLYSCNKDTDLIATKVALKDRNNG